MSPSKTSKKMIRAKINNVALFASSTRRCRKETRPRFYLRLVEMTLTLSFSFFRFPLSRWWMKTQQQIAPLCSVASLHLQDELGVRVRVSTTVHSNRQSSLHPPSSGASFVNMQSPSRRRNYRTRRIVSSFSRLGTIPPCCD